MPTGKKLLHSLEDLARMLCSLLPEAGTQRGGGTGERDSAGCFCPFGRINSHKYLLGLVVGHQWSSQQPSLLSAGHQFCYTPNSERLTPNSAEWDSSLYSSMRARCVSVRDQGGKSSDTVLPAEYTKYFQYVCFVPGCVDTFVLNKGSESKKMFHEFTQNKSQ